MVKTVLTVLALYPLLAFAQQEVERANNSPGATSQLQRVEVRGALLSGTELRRREPVAKQFYGREELDKYGDTQLSDILKRLPGINVQGGQLRMRGLGGAYTQVLINGEPAPPGFSLDNLNPRQVERLEVTKASTADQSAQAIAGTLNIILKDAPRVVQKDMRLGVQYANEKPGITAGLTYGNSVAGGMGFVLPISMYQWDWRNSFNAERTGVDALGQRQHLSSGGFERSFGHGFNVSPRLNWKLGDDETLSLQGFFVNNRFNSDSENRIELLLGNPPPSVFDVTKNYGEFNTGRLNLQYVNRFSEDRRVELRVGVTRGGADFQFDTLGYDANGAQTVHRTIVGRNRFRSSTLSVKYSQYASETQTVTVGGEFERRDRGETRRIMQNGVELLPGIEGLPFDATVDRAAIYVQDEWEISKQWSTYFGVRHEQIKTVSSGDDSFFRNTSSVTTPLLHLNFKPDPKGRNIVRASLTRSYKAPDIQQLISRPTINTDYPPTGTNTQTAPDRIGNPALRAELATGLDIAWENYLGGGGLLTVGAFHRSITGLVRNTLALQNSVFWASAPRWVATPINLGRATTGGLEIEVKGRAAELFPSLFEPTTALSLRASLNLYRSSVNDIPGPKNRLEGQQPWQLNFGADYRMKSLPVNMGFNAQIAPRFEIQQSVLQSQTTPHARSLDAFAALQLGKKDGLRLSLNGLFRPKTGARVVINNGDYSVNYRKPTPWVALNWEHKL